MHLILAFPRRLIFILQRLILRLAFVAVAVVMIPVLISIALRPVVSSFAFLVLPGLAVVVRPLVALRFA